MDNMCSNTLSRLSNCMKVGHIITLPRNVLQSYPIKCIDSFKMYDVIFCVVKVNDKVTVKHIK